MPIPPTTTAFLLLFTIAVLATRQRDLTLLVDAAFVALYARYPMPATLALIGVQAGVRRVPTLAREIAVLLRVEEPAGWTLHALLFVLPGLRTYATQQVVVGTLAPPAPVVGATAALDSASLPRPIVLPAATWFPIVQDHPDQVPHIFVLGPSGKGKSWLLEALARERRDQIVVLQPNRKQSDWSGISVVECADDGSYVPIARALEAIRSEFARRGGAMKAGDPGPWLTIVWDEIPLCIGKLGDLARQTVIDIVSAGRPRKLRLIGGSQSDHVRALGIEGYGDLIQSCAVVRIGSFAVAKMSALENMSYPACLEVDGKIHAVDRSAIPQLLRTPLSPSRVWGLPAVCLSTEGAIAPQNPGRLSQTDQTDGVAARQARVERLAGLRAMGYTRERARARLAQDGHPVDNNEWAEAGKLITGAQSTAPPA